MVNNKQKEPAQHVIIDAVFTWVNGSDSKHVAKRLHYLDDLEKPGTLAIAATSTRFQQSGELWYSVRLARKHAPWLRKIHIVTDSQTPSWLTEEIARDLDINLVDHKEIFQGFEDYLPTFNSRTIEAMLYRIPGLSEHFIYLNDDFFIIKPVQPGEYFLDGMPLIRGRWTWKNRYLAFLERNARTILGKGKGLPGLVGLRSEMNLLGSTRYFRLAHAPYVVKRSTFSQYFKDEDFLRSVIQYRFRNQNQIWPIGYYANRALREKKAKEKKTDWEYLWPEFPAKKVSVFLDNIEKDVVVKHLCIQSLDMFPEDLRDLCLGFISGISEKE